MAGSAVAGLVLRSEPRLMVVGDREWQIALLLASRSRVLILLGELVPDAMSAVPLLLSAMRQRIDVVIGTAASVRLLPEGFHSRWLVRRTIVHPDEITTPAELPIDDQVLHLPDQLRVSTMSLATGHWRHETAERNRATATCVTISGGRCMIAMAMDLQTLAAFGLGPITAVVAPNGDIAAFTRYADVAAICINARHVRDQADRISQDRRRG